MGYHAGTTGLAEASFRSLTAIPRVPTTYAAFPEGEGVRIKRVPIFAEHDRDMGDGVVFHFGLSWLKQAVLTAYQRLLDENYRPPLHLGHHDFRSTDERPAMGVFDSWCLSRVLFENKPTWLMFADLVLNNRRDLETIKGFPYRSAEVLNLRSPRPEVDSVALLSSRVPYFKLPNLQVDTTRLAYEARLGSSGFCFTWPEPLALRAAKENDTMRLTSDAARNLVAAALQSTDPKVRNAVQFEAGEFTPPGADKAKKVDALASAATPPPAKQQGDADADAAMPQAYDDAAGAPGAPAEAAPDPMAELKGMIEQLCQGMATLLKVFQPPVGEPGQGGDETQAPPQGGAPQASQARSAPVMRAQAHTPASFALAVPAAPAVSSLTPEVAALTYSLRAQNAQLNGEREKTQLVQWAQSELRDRHTGQPEDFQRDLMAQYALGGVKGAQAFVTALKNVLPALPGNFAHQPMPRSAVTLEAGDSPLLSQYAHDPALLERAQLIQQQHKARPALFGDQALEKWLESDEILAGKARKNG